MQRQDEVLESTTGKRDVQENSPGVPGNICDQHDRNPCVKAAGVVSVAGLHAVHHRESSP